MITDQLIGFRLTYEIAPIFFIGGITANSTGNGIPITSYTEGQDYSSVYSPSFLSKDTDSFFARFVVLSGGTLVDNQIATYPLVNLTVAANAVITNPLKISLRMICPVGLGGSYNKKLSVMSALKNTLAQHINLGGTFNVATPAYLYTGMLLVGLHDITSGGNPQVQYEWQWDFFQPLITTAAAQAAQNTKMGQIAAQVPPSPTGAVVPSGNIISNAATATGSTAKPPAGTFTTVPTSKNYKY